MARISTLFWQACLLALACCACSSDRASDSVPDSVARHATLGGVDAGQLGSNQLFNQALRDEYVANVRLLLTTGCSSIADENIGLDRATEVASLQIAADTLPGRDSERVSILASLVLEEQALGVAETELAIHLIGAIGGAAGEASLGRLLDEADRVGQRLVEAHIYLEGSADAVASQRSTGVRRAVAQAAAFGEFRALLDRSFLDSAPSVREEAAAGIKAVWGQ